MEPTQARVPSEEEKKLYADFIAETHKREMAGTDNFDKSVLTLSSAGLGLSLSFLKDFVVFGIVWPWVLYSSWIFFVIATLSTMTSFLLSEKALSRGKDIAYRGYICGDSDAFNERNLFNDWTGRLNYVSAAAFFLALVLTIAFVITNLKERNMEPKANTSVSTQGLSQKGLSVPSMQRPASAPSPSTPTQSTPSQSTTTPSPPVK